MKRRRTKDRNGFENLYGSQRRPEKELFEDVFVQQAGLTFVLFFIFLGNKSVV